MKMDNNYNNQQQGQKHQGPYQQQANQPYQGPYQQQANQPYQGPYQQQANQPYQGSYQQQANQTYQEPQQQPNQALHYQQQPYQGQYNQPNQPPHPNTNIPQNQNPKKSSTGLVVGIICGVLGVLLIGIICIVLLVVKFKKKTEITTSEYTEAITESYTESFTESSTEATTDVVTETITEETTETVTGNESQKIEKYTPAYETVVVGDDVLGYMTIPKKYVTFHEVGGMGGADKMLAHEQYAYGMTDIVTHGVFPMDYAISDKALAESYKKMFESGATSVSMQQSTFGNNSGYFIEAPYSDGVTVKALIFEDANGNVQYICVEGLDDEFADLYKVIFTNFTVSKSDIESTTNESTEKATETSSKDNSSKESSVDLSDDLFSGEFSFNGKKMTIPFDYSEISSEYTFDLADYGKEEGYSLKPGEYVLSTVSLENPNIDSGFSFYVGFKNLGTEDTDIKKTSVYSINMDSKWCDSDNYPKVVLPKGITWGSTLDDIKAAYGEPTTEPYYSDTLKYWEYQYSSSDKSYQITLTIYEEFGLTGIDLNH